MHRTRPTGSAALFAMLGAAVLAVLLLRPACELLPTHVAASGDPACCASLKHGDALRMPDLASPGPGGEALPGPLAVVALAGAVLLLGAAALFTSAPLRVRSFYARSTRILR